MLNKDRTLLLASMDLLAIQDLQKAGFYVDNVFTEKKIIMRIIRKLHIKMNFPFTDFWFGNWKKKMSKFDNIILFASYYSFPVVKLIKKEYPNINLLFWYWDPISNCIQPEKVRRYVDSIWSFDFADCEKYGLKYNTTFYPYILRLNSEAKNDVGVLFVGKDKGRLSLLNDIKHKLNEFSIKSYFHVVANSKYGKKDSSYKETISYLQVLNLINQSKILLEIIQKGQTGATLRCMEALFYKVKLITNNRFITNYDFYTSENIFIWGVDAIDRLPEFFLSPYKEIDSEMVARYSPQKWFERFY